MNNTYSGMFNPLYLCGGLKLTLNIILDQNKSLKRTKIYVQKELSKFCSLIQQWRCLPCYRNCFNWSYEIFCKNKRCVWTTFNLLLEPNVIRIHFDFRNFYNFSLEGPTIFLVLTFYKNYSVLCVWSFNPLLSYSIIMY